MSFFKFFKLKLGHHTLSIDNIRMSQIDKYLERMSKQVKHWQVNNPTSYQHQLLKAK